MQAATNQSEEYLRTTTEISNMVKKPKKNAKLKTIKLVSQSTRAKDSEKLLEDFKEHVQ